MRSVVGRVYGESSTFGFDFVILNPKLLKRGDYVKVWTDVDGWILAQIVDIIATDSQKLADTFKLREVLIAKAVVLGKREEGKIKMPSSPILPGENVYLAEDKFVAETLGFSNEGLYLGLLGDGNIKVKLDPSIIQKHVCILAKTGSGKSYTAAVIIEELLDRGTPTIIFDPHGEYISLKKPNEIDENEFEVHPRGYADKIRVYAPKSSPFINDADEVLVLDEKDLSAEELIELSNLRSQSAQALLYQAIRELGKGYKISDIIEVVEQMRHNAKWTLIGALSKIESSGLFGERPTDIKSLLKRGKASLIDLRGIEPSYQALIVARIASKLFELRKRGEIEPGVIVVEEAHNFIPERERTVATNALRTIASEGRKFGLCLIVISQRPARVDKNVLSQCNTQIVLRVTNPNDLSALKKGIEGITPEIVEEIKRLPPGRAVIVSPSLDFPIIVRIRVRKSFHGEFAHIVARKEDEEKGETEKKKEKTGLFGFLKRRKS